MLKPAFDLLRANSNVMRQKIWSWSHAMKLIIASSKTLKDRVHGHNPFSFLMQLTSLSVLIIKIAQVVLMLTYMYMHVDIELFTTDETKINHIDFQWH